MSARRGARSYLVQNSAGIKRHLYASRPAAEFEHRRWNANRGEETKPMLVVDHDDLCPVELDEYQHAEARMLYWAERAQRLRPGAPLPSKEWTALTNGEARRLIHAYRAWTSPLDSLREIGEERLREVLAVVVDKLDGP